MHLFGKLQAALHGKADTLKHIPFAELSLQGAENHLLRQFQEDAPMLDGGGDTI